MHKLVITSTFHIKTEEQAGYIQKLLSDLADVLDVDDSETKFILEEVVPKVNIPRRCVRDGCDNRPMHHYNICELHDFEDTVEHINSHY